jgi:hypothetical protein
LFLNTDNTEAILRSALKAHGAREFEVVALTMNADRGLAALRYAEQKGAERPIQYAIKLYDSEEWQPSGKTKRQATNLAVDRSCVHCSGDRFVPVTDDPKALYGESYAPCIYCNKDANTSRWVGAERRETAAR